MSMFLSQINLDAKEFDEDHESSLDKEDREQEKELKEFLEKELDDDFFDDEASFSSLPATQNNESYFDRDREQEQGHVRDNQAKQHPLLTSRAQAVFSNRQPLNPHAAGGALRTRGFDSPYYDAIARDHNGADSSFTHGGHNGLQDTNNNRPPLGSPVHSDSFYAYFGNLQEPNEEKYRTDRDAATKNDPPGEERERDDIDAVVFELEEVSAGNLAMGPSPGTRLAKRESLLRLNNGEEAHLRPREAVLSNGHDDLGNRFDKGQSDFTHQAAQSRDEMSFDREGERNGRFVSKIPTPQYSSLPLSYRENSDHIMFKESTMDPGDPASEVTQLRILYEARGKKIVELQKKMETKEEDQGRELRILKHELHLLKGEREGLTVSLQQAQKLNAEYKRSITSLQKETSKQAEETLKLQKEKEEVLEKLIIAESTIESLSNQIKELNHADSIGRARAHHEAILASTRERYEEEILHLKEKLDETRRNLEWKTEDVSRLNDELTSLQKSANDIRGSSAETVNTLTRHLQESQNRCQELIEKGGNGFSDNAVELNTRLHSIEKENEKLLVRVKELEADNNDLKEKLYSQQIIHEANGAPLSSTPYNPSAALAGRNPLTEDTATPISRFGNSGQVVSPAESLRDELIKSLAANRMKREEIGRLKIELESVKNDAERKERIMDALNVKLGEAAKYKEEQELKKDDIDVLKQQVNQLENQLEKETSDLEKERQRCVAMSETVKELRSHMAEMVRDFDKEKIDNLERQHKVYMDFSEEVRRKVEDQLASDYQQRINELQEQINELNNRNLEIKEEYVSLAEEHRKNEESVRQECQKEAELSIEKVRNSMEEEMMVKLKELRERLLREHENRLAEEKGNAKRAKEAELEERVNKAVSKAKEVWAWERDGERKTAQIELEDLKSKYLAETEDRIAQVKREQEIEFEKDKDEAIMRVRSELEREFKIRMDSLRLEMENNTLNTKHGVENLTPSAGEDIKEIRMQLEKEIQRLKSTNIVLESEVDSLKDALKESAQKHSEDLSQVKSAMLAEESLRNVREKQLRLEFDQERRKKELEIEKLRKVIEFRKSRENDIQKRLVSANKELASVTEKLFSARGDYENLRDNSVVAKGQFLDDLKLAVEDVEAVWALKVSQVRQEVMKEESHKLRLQIMAEVEREQAKNFEERLREERDRLKVESESVIITELKETIFTLRRNFEERLLESNKAEVANAVRDARREWKVEKETELNNLEETLKTNAERELAKLKDEYEGQIRETRRKMESQLKQQETSLSAKHDTELVEKMRQAKEEWNSELKKLNKEHQLALAAVRHESRSELDREREKLTASSQEFFWSLRNEYQEKLKKQRAELEEYYNGFVEKALEHSRKEWTSTLEKKVEEAFEKGRNESRLSPVGKSNCSHSDNTPGCSPTFSDRSRKGAQKRDQEPPRENLEEPLKTLLSSWKKESDAGGRLNSSLFEDFLSQFEEEMKKFQKEAKSTSVDRGVQTASYVPDNEVCLQEMREFYLDALQKVKVDFTDHIRKTRENATDSIRKEVAKERKIIVNRIKKYYLKLLEQNRDRQDPGDHVQAFQTLVGKFDFSKEGSVPSVSTREVSNQGQTRNGGSVELRPEANRSSNNRTRPKSMAREAPKQRHPDFKRNTFSRPQSPSISVLTVTTDKSCYAEFPSGVSY